MMKLGFFLYGTGHHIASWRAPGVVPNANQSLQHYIDITQTAERGLFDFAFNADSNSTFGPDDPEMWKRTTNAMRLEPLTLLGALSAVTTHIGLIMETARAATSTSAVRLPQPSASSSAGVVKPVLSLPSTLS